MAVTRFVRAGLVALGVSALAAGLPALLVPRRFYDDFPFAGHWVDRLGPYNAHLVTDVGAFYLAFAVLFLRAAARPTHDAVVTVCSAWTVFSAAHLSFHVTHLDGFPLPDAIAETVSLALVTVVWLLILGALRRDGVSRSSPGS